MPAIVVGAGAAGLTAAIFAARTGVPVVLVETRDPPGAKIRVSGGGRCNVLPSTVSPRDFHTSGSPNALRNILLSWPLPDVRAFFEHDLGVPLVQEPSGKLFPRSNRSRDVVEALLAALHRSGAVLRAPFRVKGIDRRDDGAFEITSSTGERLAGRTLVLATGGLSLPKTGSDGVGLALARGLGHRVVAPYPALVPLRSSDPGWGRLAGVSVHVSITVERDGRIDEERQGDLLFTHRGFSGPVVLDVSRHVTSSSRGAVLRVRWGRCEAGEWDASLREGGRRTLAGTVRRRLPSRLAEALLAHAGLDPALRLADLTRDRRARLVETLDGFVLPVSGDEGYATAEVTGGGIPLAEIRTKTLESRVAPGLHLCGEMLDVTGRLGGYNFLWAWVTGRKVGQALAVER